MVRENSIAIVGCGPGSPDQLTEAARLAIRRADVLVGTERLLAAHAAADQERIPVQSNIARVLDEIADRRERAKIAVLVTGDPGLCSLARPVLRRFGRESCEIFPGISAVQVAFARLGLEWLDARIVGAHARVPELSALDLAGHEAIAILGGHRDAQRWCAGVAADLGEAYTVVTCEDLTLEGECVRRVSPAELAAAALSTRTVILLLRKELLS